MDFDSLFAILPAMLGGVVGAIPVVLNGLPSRLTDQMRMMAAFFLVASAWVIYLLVLHSGYTWMLFSPTLTLLLVVAAMLLLAALLYLALRSHSSSPVVITSAYIIAVSSLLAGFTNHAAMNGRIAVLVECEGACRDLSNLKWTERPKNGGDPNQDHRAQLVEGCFGVGAVWPQEDFDNVVSLSIRCDDDGAPWKILNATDGEYLPWGAGQARRYVFRCPQATAP